jgi:penicillin-binding protein 1A
MVKMMRGVVNAGTGGRLRFKYGIYNDVAGKTGTTNNQADAWFIGYAPQLIAGVWVGCDDREFRFRSERLGQGASAALPIWAFFMKRVYADKKTGINPNKSFDRPKDFDDCEVSDTASFNPFPAKKSRKDTLDVEEGAPPTQEFYE